MADDEDVSLDNILDPILRSKVRGIIPALGKTFTTREIKDAILTCQGDVNDATDLLFGDAPKEVQDAVELLEKRIPLQSREQIMKILIKCLGNRELAEISFSKQISTEGSCETDSEEHSYTTILSLNSQTGHSIGVHTEINQKTSDNRESRKDNTNGKGLDASTVVSDMHSIIRIKDEVEGQDPNTDAAPSPSDLTSLSSDDILLPSRRISPAPATRCASAEIAESSRSRVRFLHEIFGPRITEEMCEDTLQSCKGSIEDACEILQKQGGLDYHSNDENNKTAKDCCPATKQSLINSHNTESGHCGQKRKATNVDNSSYKRFKSGTEDEEESSEDLAEEGFSLEPASEWVRRYFPGGSSATILLGPEEELRDTIPRRLLYENSSFFSDHYDTAEAEEWDNDTVRLPDVDPQMFDVIIQFLVSKTFTLEPDPNRSTTTEITIILDLVFLAERLGFPDPSDPVIERLRGILVEDRRALKRKHIKRAFELEEEHAIQHLFVHAVVRDYMKARDAKLNSNEINTEATDDDDDESVYPDEAHRAFYNKDKFWFRREIRSIRAFKYQLLEEQDTILKSGKKIVTRQATRRQRETHTIKYVDPLDGEWFYL